MMSEKKPRSTMREGSMPRFSPSFAVIH